MGDASSGRVTLSDVLWEVEEARLLVLLQCMFERVEGKARSWMGAGKDTREEGVVDRDFPNQMEIPGPSKKVQSFYL